MSELDDRELERLKELVPYKVLAPTPDEICDEIERLNNIINEIEKELDLNLPFKVIGVRGLKNKIKELKENK